MPRGSSRASGRRASTPCSSTVAWSSRVAVRRASCPGASCAAATGDAPDAVARERVREPRKADVRYIVATAEHPPRRSDHHVPSEGAGRVECEGHQAMIELAPGGRDDTTPTRGEAALGGAKPLLKVENLLVEFSGRNRTVRAVRGLSYQIRPGETLGLVGESGSGKSVSALSLLGLLPKRVSKTGGSAQFEGR